MLKIGMRADVHLAHEDVLRYAAEYCRKWKPYTTNYPPTYSEGQLPLTDIP